MATLKKRKAPETREPRTLLLRGLAGLKTGTYGLRRYRRAYTLKELPQPQVLLTLGLLNLNPAPSSVSI